MKSGKTNKLELNTDIRDGIWKLDNAIIRVENGEIKRIDNGDWKYLTKIS